jgi:hypothetical protein
MKTVLIILFLIFFPCVGYEYPPEECGEDYTFCMDGDKDGYVTTSDFFRVLDYMHSYPDECFLATYDLVEDGKITPEDLIPWALIQNHEYFWAVVPESKEYWSYFFDDSCSDLDKNFLVAGITWDCYSPFYGEYIANRPFGAMYNYDLYQGVQCGEIYIGRTIFRWPNLNKAQIDWYREWWPEWDGKYFGVILDVIKDVDGFHIVGYYPSCFGYRGYVAQLKFNGDVVFQWFNKFIPVTIHSRRKFCFDTWLEPRPNDPNSPLQTFALLANKYTTSPPPTIRDILEAWFTGVYTFINYSIAADLNGVL